MAPYRLHREEKPVAAPKTGLVADMVRQFADPYAFLRELVQNGIDAGATAIWVRVSREPGGVASTSVTDDGCGMTPEIMEGPLLTLFSSSKEGDLTKIGKYGVGFISVFALEPEEVQVTTWRDGRAYLLRLSVDHRYSIAEAPARTGSGTIVSLVKRLDALAYGAHVDGAREALGRWCRHAERPIHLEISDLPGEQRSIYARADVPFTVEAPIAVTAKIDDETFVVGPSAGASLLAPADARAADLERGETFAGFYNRGLTLFETGDELFPALRGIRFKVKSPHLQHTLSRDNVRRDEAFDRVVGRARDLVRGELRRALVAALSRAAVAAAGGERVTEHAALLEAALSPPIGLEAGEIAFPLACPIKGAAALADLGASRAGRLGPLFAAAPDAITEALARAGVPVALAAHPAVVPALRRCFSSAIPEEARRAFLLVGELPKSEQGEVDLALSARVQHVIAAAGEEVGRVALGAIEGEQEGRSAVVVPDERAPSPSPRLCSAADIEASWRRWSSKHRLLLNVRSAAVRAARALAGRDPALAAHLLGRALLLEGRGPLDPAENAALLALGGEAMKEAR